jgi:sugar-specific transcriptional regulator TrmB
MLLNESLEKSGLSSREAKVYLAALELGRSRVQEIAKKAGLPRSTTYSVLEALISKNLIFFLGESKIKEYSAEDPQKIANLSEETARTIKEVLPDLKEIYRSAKSRPQIKYHEGLQAIKEMYNDMLRQKEREYLIFGPESTWMQMDEKWFSEFKKRRASAKIKTRLIITDSPEARLRKKQEAQDFSEVRILPRESSQDITAGVYIFREKVMFAEYRKNLISLEIQSKAIAEMQRLMFERLWSLLK